jgi:hypothetical protein
VLSSITVVLLGIKNMLFPSETLELYGLDLKGALIHNTFRGAISGTLVGIGLMLLMGLFTKNKMLGHKNLRTTQHYAKVIG